MNVELYCHFPVLFGIIMDGVFLLLSFKKGEI